MKFVNKWLFPGKNMGLYIERSPRVNVRLGIDISNKDKLIRAYTLNVSIGGFAVHCSTEERNRITPQGDFVGDGGRPVEVDVNLQLPNQHGKKECIHARCRVVYSRRIAQEKCQLGLSYINLLGDGEDKLMMFIKRIDKEQ